MAYKTAIWCFHDTQDQMKHALTINGVVHVVEVSDDTPLLWVLRDVLLLHGTKYGCGIGQCGVCTVLVGEKAQRSCLLPVGQVHEAVTTIEGLPADHPVKQAWISEQVPQCGYCQSGQIMQATALLQQVSKPTEAQIRTAMRGVLCRCGTYNRIAWAVRVASEQAS